MKQSEVHEVLEAAQQVTWFNLPKLLTVTLLTIADALLSIAGELKLIREQLKGSGQG